MSFTCEQGHTHQKAKIDGYYFGDRLLEGVMFTVWQDEQGNWQAELEDNAYTRGLNKEHWIQQCKEFCDGYDVFTCIECSDDIYVDVE